MASSGLGGAKDELASRSVLTRPRSPDRRQRYLHWDKLRHLRAARRPQRSEQWWLGESSSARRRSVRLLPLTDTEGRPFHYSLPDRGAPASAPRRSALRAGGGDGRGRDLRRAGDGSSFLVNSLMEEAIRSSQLEGATTSRRVAKELLRSGREPTDRSERMIAQQLPSAAVHARGDRGERSTPALVLELHRILTEGTLDEPAAAGRLQRPDDDRVVVYDRDDGRASIHRPAAGRGAARAAAGCSATSPTKRGRRGRFVHPVVRGDPAALLARLRPSVRGRQRPHGADPLLLVDADARLLAGRVPADLARSSAKRRPSTRAPFLETETDDGDTTYFLHPPAGGDRAGDRRITTSTSSARSPRCATSSDRFRTPTGSTGASSALLTDAIRHPDARLHVRQPREQPPRHPRDRSLRSLPSLDERGLLRPAAASVASYLFEPAPDLPERLKESPA